MVSGWAGVPGWVSSELGSGGLWILDTEGALHSHDTQIPLSRAPGGKQMICHNPSQGPVVRVNIVKLQDSKQS